MKCEAGKDMKAEGIKVGDERFIAWFWKHRLFMFSIFRFMI
jgi:hypothetical protein